MGSRRVLVLFLLASALAPVRGHGGEEELAACTVHFAADPESEESAKCFHQAGQGPGAQEPAIRRLEELRARYPGRPWLLFYLGHLRWTEPARGEELFHQAAELFAARGEARGEILARDSRERVLMQMGRSGDADREVARAVQVASAAGDPALVLRGQLLETRHLLSQKRDVERAYFLIRRAEAAAFPNASYTVQRDCLLLLGNVSLELGRIREARGAFRRLARLAHGFGDRFAEATASYSLARSLTDEMAELPGEAVRREALATARQALEAAEAAGHRGVEAKARLILGMLSTGVEARQQLERCVETAAMPAEKSYCLDLLARRLAAEDPGRATALIEQALALARESEDRTALAATLRERMRASWLAAPPARAAADSLSALKTMEALRESESGAARSPELSAAGADDYSWLSGRLLEAAAAGGGADLLDRAFDVAERMRSRALVGALEAARAKPAETPATVRLRERRATALAAIAGAQHRLLDPELPAWEKAEAHHDLERLELEEADLRYQIAQANPAHAALLRPGFVSLAEARRSLAADEALLSFQIAPWKDLTGSFGGGSWLLAATRGGAHAYRLMDRVDLRPAVALLTGLLEARDGAEAAGCAGLCRALLGPALRDLPPGIRRLIIVPDDALNKLPFGALREGAGGKPLALRYEISVVPSATLWLRWRRSRPATAAIPALAFADPPLPGGGARAAARERAAIAIFTSGVRLGPLPYAREESRSVVRDLGGGSVRRLGEDASESFLKGAPLQAYGVLHFATHAVTDETNPDRSGVLLAPGASQDGLLQIREIIDLDLDGRVVVLSACSSNTGALLRGEGVMSLARAFFQAGAHTVVASLWRLRDDEAADFFDRFYRHLGRGLSVSAALQSAQRELVTAGAPAAAWAGIVVLGDGDRVPLPGGRKGLEIPLWVWGLGVLVLLAGLGTFYRFFTRRRQTTV
jgi:hypothetical protein